jgi:cell division protein FtsN
LPEVPAGVTRLELVESAVLPSAAPQAAVTAATPPSSPAAPASVPAAPPTAARACFRVGPFAERAAADLARGRIDPTVGRAIPRETPGRGASGYRVSLPPMASREEAVAMAQRIGAAGFDDFLVINQGEETNGIALGRYRSREGAERRQTQLAAAGFPARIHAIGEEGPSRWWLDIAAVAGTTAPALRPLAGVPVEPQDCPAALR